MSHSFVTREVCARCGRDLPELYVERYGVDYCSHVCSDGFVACPSCGREPVGPAFGTTDTYVRCSLGHVFAR